MFNVRTVRAAPARLTGLTVGLIKSDGMVHLRLTVRPSHFSTLWTVLVVDPAAEPAEREAQDSGGLRTTRIARLQIAYLSQRLTSRCTAAHVVIEITCTQIALEPYASRSTGSVQSAERKERARQPGRAAKAIDSIVWGDRPHLRLPQAAAPLVSLALCHLTTVLTLTLTLKLKLRL